MTKEWKDCSALSELAAAVERGDEIQRQRIQNDDADGWYGWDGLRWNCGDEFRCRPCKRAKTVVVLREALMQFNDGHSIVWLTDGAVPSWGFIRWLDTPAREVEVPE